MEIGEMSAELTNALNKYNEITSQRILEWNRLRNEKARKNEAY